MGRVARGLGRTHGRQVRHVEGTGRFLERPLPSVTLDRIRVCLNTSVRQLSSAGRGTGVYSSSLPLLGLTRFPVAPGARRPGQTWARADDKRRTAQAWSPRSRLCSKTKPVLVFAQKLLYMISYFSLKTAEII